MKLRFNIVNTNTFKKNVEQMDGKTEPPYYNADSQKYIIGMLIEVILIVQNILKVKNSS